MVYTILVVILGAGVIVWLGGVFVAWVLRPYVQQLDVDDGLVGGGRLIGYSERLMIYVFVLAGAPAAIGFLVAAKSIYSFGEFSGEDPHKRSQYVIIGTLVSFAYAVTLSYLIRWLLLHVVLRG
jgi:hypothetical protein